MIGPNERAQLLGWFAEQRRDLPWRHTRDPYAIWVSEAMLQQTQVSTVIPYWERWMTRFPTVESLAQSDEQDVLTQWQGLGYYRRARQLLAGARYVSERGLPQSAEEWRAVPGVGPYTAGAIASISQGEAAPLVDGNVQRVYSRLCGDASTASALTRATWNWATENVDAARPGDWNQALMELGATVCRPVQPICEVCPWSEVCVARAEGRTQDLPTRTPKVAATELRQVVWIPWFEGRYGVRQIPTGEWWEGMWEFPRAEDDSQFENATLRDRFGEGSLQSLGRHRHAVTRYRITIEAFLFRPSRAFQGLTWESAVALADRPMPAPQRRLLERAEKILREHL